jgi:hypothetical protein
LTRRAPAPPGAPRHIAAARLAAVAVIAAAWAICLALNWPGHFTWDSVMQLAEGRRGLYSGQHPPVMSWLLRLADAARPGAAAFVVVQVTLVFGALMAFATLGRGSWLAAPLAAAFATFPQLILYPAIVWKDVLFAGAACGGFAALAWAGVACATPVRRWALLSVSVALLALATLARQNGAVVLPFAAGAVWWFATQNGARRPLVVGARFLAALAAIVLTASAALGTRVTGSDGVAEQWEHLQTYDIVGAAARDPGFRFGVLQARAPRLAALLRGDGVPVYSPARIDTLADPIFTETDGRRDLVQPLADQWRALILDHPLLYLRQRAAAFRWVLLTPAPSECVMAETGVDGDPDALAAAGLTERQTPRDEALDSYAGAFARTPVLSHAVYGLAAIGLAIMLVLRRHGADIAVAAMLGGALAFTASFAVISIACDYRYLYFLDLSAIAAALYLAATVRRGAGA